jgi:hypothetical protein
LFNGGAAELRACHHETTAATLRGCRRAAAGLATDARYVVEQTTFGGFTDAQFHPLGVGCTSATRPTRQPAASSRFSRP